MENWNNLNKTISLERKNAHLNQQLAQQMIDLCTKGERQEVKQILKQGAPINCFEDGLTPLITSMANNHYDLTVYLLKAGASVSFKKELIDDDALWYAVRNKQHRYLELFINNRCLLTRDENTNDTVLIYATIHSDLEAVKILLGHYNIKVNDQNRTGNTALHYNVAKTEPSQDDLEIGLLLMAAGADTNVRNLDGHNVDEMANDFAARAMLMNARLQQELPVNEVEHNVEPTTDPDTGISYTKNKRVKI